MKFEMMKLLTIIMATSLCCLTRAAQMSSAKISCQPAIVGQERTQLVVQFLTDITIPIGSILEVVVPSSTSVEPGQI